MAFKMKADPPLANGDIDKKPWKTYTSSILNDEGEVTKPVVNPVDKVKAATEKVNVASKKYLDAVEDEKITLGKVKLFGSGESVLNPGVELSINPAAADAEANYKRWTNRFKTAKEKIKKK